MRRIALFLLLAAIGLLVPSEARAKIITLKGKTGKNGLVAPDRNVEHLTIPCPPAQARAGVMVVAQGLQAPAGPFPSAQAAYGAPAVYCVQPVGKCGHSSPVHTHLDALRRRVHHEPPHCAQCYATGVYCSCCSHTPVVLCPGTLRYLLYDKLAKHGLIETF